MDRTETARLILTPLSPEDLEDAFAVDGDPLTWAHLPSGRHTRRAQTAALITAASHSWQTHGLGPWALRTSGAGEGDDPEARTFVGTGGVIPLGPGLWNLGYRLAPGLWGRGLATEMATAAIRAAQRSAPGTPVVARVLSNNPASSAVARRAGLELCWEGPTGDAVADGVYRQIYTNRALTREQSSWLAARA